MQKQWERQGGKQDTRQGEQTAGSRLKEGATDRSRAGAQIHTHIHHADSGGEGEGPAAKEAHATSMRQQAANEYKHETQ